MGRDSPNSTKGWPPMNPSDDLEPLAQRLATWRPAPVPSGRDRILYEAGVAAGRRQARWQLAAIVLPLLVGSTGWIWHERTERHRVELALTERTPAPTVLTRHEPAPTPLLRPVVPPDPMSYLILSHRLNANVWDRFDPIEPHSGHVTPANQAVSRPILTPLSGRNPQEFADL